MGHGKPRNQESGDGYRALSVSERHPDALPFIGQRRSLEKSPYLAVTAVATLNLPFVSAVMVTAPCRSVR